MQPVETPSGGVIWFTGLSGAGKSTLSRLVGAALLRNDIPVEILDGDLIRKNLSYGLGFSREDRDTNIRRIGFVAGLLARHGVWVLVAAISPYRETRHEVRKQINAEGRPFLEVYVKCPLSVAEARDPKGLYRRARSGELPAFTGISDPYEEPLNPELVIETDTEGAEASTLRVLRLFDSSRGKRSAGR